MTTNFFAPGIGLLALSLLTTVLAPHSGGAHALAFVAWIETATFWLGIVFVAAHLLQELLHGPRG